MSKDLNQCNFIGRIGKPIELKYTKSNVAVASFSIACGDDYKDKQGNKVEKTEWVNCTAFDKLAEIISKYCDKGSKVFVTGKFTTQKYQAQDGSDRYATTIKVDNLQILDSKPNADQSNEPRNQQDNRQAPAHGAPQQPAGFDDFDDMIF